MTRSIGLDYREAVEMATWYLRRERYDEKGRDLYQGGEAYEALSERIGNLFSKPFVVGDLYGTNFETVNNGDDILSTRLGFDAALNRLAQKIECGEHLDETEKVVVTNLLRGKLVRPTGKDGAKKKDFYHSRIIWAIAWLNNEGLSKTRAIAAVKDAINEGLKIGITDGTIKDIWNDHRLEVLAAENLMTLPATTGRTS